MTAPQTATAGTLKAGAAVSSPAPAHSFYSTDTHGAAAYLSIAYETLRTWRKLKRGPAYRKLGRKVVYLRADLDAYLDASKPTASE